MPNPRTRSPLPIDCTCPKASHEHGTIGAYKVDKCGCPQCRAAKQAYDNDYNHRRRGITPTIPSDQAKKHLDWLLASGTPHKVIAEQTGVSRATITKILNGRAPRIYRDVNSLILAATPAPAPPREGWVDATGARRRLQGLSVAGWSGAAVAAAAGLSQQHLRDVRTGRTKHVLTTTAEKITTATRVLLTREPPAGHATACVRATAQRQGWVSLYAYDDIDDPRETPNVTPLRGGGNADRAVVAAERIGDLSELIYAGVPVLQAITRTGFPTPKAAYEAARHQGRTDLVELLLPEVAAQGVRTRAAA